MHGLKWPIISARIVCSDNGPMHGLTPLRPQQAHSTCATPARRARSSPLQLARAVRPRSACARHSPGRTPQNHATSLKIIHNARIKTVCVSESCMLDQVRIVFRAVSATWEEAEDGGWFARAWSHQSGWCGTVANASVWWSNAYAILADIPPLNSTGAFPNNP